MTDKEFVLTTMREYGMRRAQDLQETSEGMTGTELYEKEDYIPDFSAAVAKKNMLEQDGRVPVPVFCRAYCAPYPKLQQRQEPEELPAQWGFYWSDDPKKALPFVAMSTSPYMTGNCCTHNGHVWQSGQDNNVWEPGTVNVKWTDLGTIEEVMGA